MVGESHNSWIFGKSPCRKCGTGAGKREYQAFGVLNDVQIGLGSDIVSVTVAG